MSAVKEFENNLIIRFLMNEASGEDIGMLQSRIAEDAAFRKHFEQIRDTWNKVEVEYSLNREIIERDLNRVVAKTSRSTFIRNRKIFSVPAWIPRAAAVFVAGFALSWYVFEYQPASSPDSTVYNTVHTPRGSNSAISLADGSTITLNAQSTLKYPDRFSGKKREVYLEGEAFFEVADDKDRQFIVRTPDIAVRVYGTSFNVKCYPDENTVETTLVEGSISLVRVSSSGTLAGSEIRMEPNQQLVLYKSPKKPEPSEATKKAAENQPQLVQPKIRLSKHIDTERYTSWKDGQLKIISEPLQTLAITLERRYDVTIHFEEEQIRQYRFTGVIKNETIEQVMAAIKLASSIDYRIDERDVWIMSRKQ